MKNTFLLITCFCLFLTASYAQNLEGYTVDNININTTRIKTAAVLDRFQIKSGDVFKEADFNKAKEDLHNMRIFKTLDFELTPKPENKLDISINGKDGYYVFPLFFITGGAKSAYALSLAEGNIFKRGESALLLASAGEDGASLSTALVVDDNIFRAEIVNLNFDRNFYSNGWSGTYGIFNTGKDEKYFKHPLYSVYTKQDSAAFMYGRKFGDITLSVQPKIRHISYSQDIDGGNHNSVAFGISIKDNMPQGANMGALFGFGLSDKKQSLADLPKTKYGYLCAAGYETGGQWNNSDYDINKVNLRLATIAELKSRHIVFAAINAADSFGSPFNEQVTSTELLNGNGSYLRQRTGKRGIGFNTAFSYFLVRNNLGLLSLTPFYELSYVYNTSYQQHSGTGAVLAYKFWRFPFPLGIGYTKNLTDGSYLVSFTMGAKF